MPTQPVVQLFFNPTSGSYSYRRIDALIGAFRAAGADVIQTPSQDCAPVLAERSTHVCIAGGDGTIRHVAAELARSGRAMPAAIYPAGTINLLAREGAFGRSPAACARELLHGKTSKAHHPVAIGETMFLACASAGPDSFAVANVSPALKRRIGRLAYAASFMRALWRWPRPRFAVATDRGIFECEAVYIAKGRYFAGPWSFAPAARVGDQLLHVVLLPRARRRDFFRFVLAMLMGRDPGRSRSTVGFTCTNLVLRNEETFPIQADGDIVAHGAVNVAIGASPIHFR